MGAAFGKIVDLIVEFVGLASEISNLAFTDLGVGEAEPDPAGDGNGPSEFEICQIPASGNTFAVGPNGQAKFPPGPGQGDQAIGEGFIPIGTNGELIRYDNENGAVISGVHYRLKGCTALTPVVSEVTTSVLVTLRGKVGKSGMVDWFTTIGPGANTASASAPVIAQTTSVPVVTVISEVGKTGTENHGTTIFPRGANTASSEHLVSSHQTVWPTRGSLSTVSSPSPTTMVTKHVISTTALAPTIQRRSGLGTSLDQNSETFVNKGYLACLIMAFFAILGIGSCIIMKRRQKKKKRQGTAQEGRVEMSYSYAGID